MKRSASGEQTLDLNKIDFERAGTARKAGYKFTIKLNNGRVSNVISTSPLAPDLATVVLQDKVIKDLLVSNDYEISLNTKFQLHIKNVSAKPQDEDNVESNQEEEVS